MLDKLKKGWRYFVAFVLAAVGLELALDKLRKERLIKTANRLAAQQNALGVQIQLTQAELEKAAQDFEAQKGQDASDEDIKSFYLHLLASRR